MKKQKKKELILDCSKWICGQPDTNENNQNCLGKSFTSLLSERGFMCCLGQFAPQLNSKIKHDDLLGWGEPCDIEINYSIPLLTIRENGNFHNTIFANDAMKINDDTTTPVKTKIEKLSSLLKKRGYKLKVINLPEHLK